MRIIVLGLAFFLSGQVAVAAPAQALFQAAGLYALPEPLPSAIDFQLYDLDGRKRRLQTQRGKVVFLNFWATWCAPCRHEMPLMQQLYQAFRGKPFVIWAVAMQEEREQVAPFMSENRIRFPALLDVDGTVSTRYKIRGLPTTYLIDCAGSIVGQAIGPRPWDHQAVHTLLTALVSETSCK